MLDRQLRDSLDDARRCKHNRVATEVGGLAEMTESGRQLDLEGA